jgi:mannose-6-phosphate isomerase-like protein (cupin superfamily)
MSITEQAPTQFSRTDGQAPTRFARTEYVKRAGPNCRTIVPPAPGGWTEPALFEWELRAESWTDEHPHTEYNYVIEGEVFIESGGVTLEAHAGDVVRVPACSIGRYWSPTYARLLAIYGPSSGAPSRALGYEKFADKG